MKSMLALVERHKQGEQTGIYAVCSAHPLVLEAALRLAAEGDELLLVEATSNQVDQFGGYTGMTPADFRDRLYELAAQCHFPAQRLILGATIWAPTAGRGNRPSRPWPMPGISSPAMSLPGSRRSTSTAACPVRAIPFPLTDELVAERAARLAQIAEQTCLATFGESDLVYVIGTEVPVPGGAHEDLAELAVTTPEAARHTLEAHQQAFNKAGLAHIWPRVIGLVVQPGVEFDHTRVIDYRPEKAAPLSRMIEAYPHMVFEAHSTDYQTPEAYRQLVRDHFAILKVGPALTFALREALFALAAIEEELVVAKACSGLRKVMEETMLERPDFWRSHYQGSANECRLARGYSYSDRIRYYWPDSRVDECYARLLANLAAEPIPLPLLSQHLPLQYRKVRHGSLSANPHDLILDQVQEVLRHYASACTAASRRHSQLDPVV